MRASLWLLLWLLSVAPVIAAPLRPNDNTLSAGRPDGDQLQVRLFADLGAWRPEGPGGASIEVAAFGEEGADLAVPGPLIRVRAGTTVVLTLRNALSAALRVNGLCARPSAAPCTTLTVEPGASREVRFRLDAAGTYYYWGTTGGPSFFARPVRDTQLNGGIVVDPPEGSPPDRVFVLSDSGGPSPPLQPRTAAADAYAINGLSWPHTERLHHTVGDRVRWRIVNLSWHPHAMHLHGAYFTVEATGDLAAEARLAADMQRLAVTEYVAPTRSFTMSWTPERPGNWVFHCHMTSHMHPMSASGHAGHAAGGHAVDDGAAGMAGLVLGIHVAGTDGDAAPGGPPPRRLSLLLSEEPGRYGPLRGFRMELEGADAPRLNPGPVPGPVLVLTRGEPVEITVVNRMTEPTAIHWHGIELDSYFDGVPGWGGRPGNLAPPVAPGQSFVARFTPPRAGTFIYHTHWHSDAQLSGGLYGPLLVLEPGERYDPATDHVVMLGLNGAAGAPDTLWAGREWPMATLNGRRSPEPIVMRAGVPNRLRLINIMANGVAPWMFLVEYSGVVTPGASPFGQQMWRPLAKDGAALPAAQTAPRPAQQRVTVGETYDFEVRPTRPLLLEVRTPDGGWLFQVPIRVR